MPPKDAPDISEQKRGAAIALRRLGKSSDEIQREMSLSNSERCALTGAAKYRGDE